jgi:hypothetical protein
MQELASTPLDRFLENNVLALWQFVQHCRMGIPAARMRSGQMVNSHQSGHGSFAWQHSCTKDFSPFSSSLVLLPQHFGIDYAGHKHGNI